MTKKEKELNVQHEIAVSIKEHLEQLTNKKQRELAVECLKRLVFFFDRCARLNKKNDAIMWDLWLDISCFFSKNGHKWAQGKRLDPRLKLYVYGLLLGIDESELRQENDRAVGCWTPDGSTGSRGGRRK